VEGQRLRALHSRVLQLRRRREFEKEHLGIHEKLEGFHDDYYITAIIATVSTDAIRMKERKKAGQVRHQWRRARSDCEDDRERQEDGRVPNGGHGCRNQEVDGEQEVKS
jgi:hypothetical protein